MNVAIFWDVAQFSSYVNIRFGRTYHLQFHGRKSAEQETSVLHIRFTRCDIPEDGNIPIVAVTLETAYALVCPMLRQCMLFRQIHLIVYASVNVAVSLSRDLIWSSTQQLGWKGKHMSAV
jgi:hypothetical protein